MFPGGLQGMVFFLKIFFRSSECLFSDILIFSEMFLKSME